MVFTLILTQAQPQILKNKTLITDSATKLANANLIVSDVTEIENLTTTEGDDIVDATVGWAVNVNLGRDDTVTTNGNGGVFRVAEATGLQFTQPIFRHFMCSQQVQHRVLCGINRMTIIL